MSASDPYTVALEELIAEMAARWRCSRAEAIGRLILMLSTKPPPPNPLPPCAACGGAGRRHFQMWPCTNCKGTGRAA